MSEQQPVKSVRTIGQVRHELSVKTTPEKAPKKHRAAKFIGKFAMAAACVIPPADLALSDVTTAKVLDTIQKNVSKDSAPLEKGIELGGTGLFIAAESLLLGQAMTRNKKLRGAFDDFEAYSEEKRATRGPIKRGASWVATRPFAALEKIGKGAEHLGEKLSHRKSRAARLLGQVAIDAGQVNAVGTSTVIMQETMANNTPSFKRQAYLSGLIAGSWVGGAELVRQGYRYSPSAIQTGLAAFGRTFETLTTVNIANPAETPIGSLAVGSVVAGFGYMGWRIEEFRQQRAERLGVDPNQLHEAIEDFQLRQAQNITPETEVEG
jgi:hypothetical protein